MRKLVTIREISALTPIDGADFIELAQVDGWNCVVKKGEFKEGDRGMFFEIDSLIPVDDPRFAFMTSNIREYDGIRMARIRTMKLRGQISQGLMLPIERFKAEIYEVTAKLMLAAESEEDLNTIEDGNVNYAEALGVRKYERIESGNGGIKPAGDFPWFAPKTDQPRIQNFHKHLLKQNQDMEFAVTLKMDGSSTTVIYTTDEKYHIGKLDVDENNGQMIVCSRNLTLKDEDDNRWWAGVRNSGLDKAVKNHNLETGRNLAFQGELVGGNIQGNHENHKEFKVYIFSIYDVDNARYLSYDEFEDIMNSDTFVNVPRVPVLETIRLSDFNDVKSYLDYAEKVKSPFCKIPEGVVFHRIHCDDNDYISFKAISNRYLLKCD